MSDFKKLSAYVDVPCEWVSATPQCSTKIDQLQAENEKLRAWLSDVYTIFWSGQDCCECPWFAECDSDTGCAWMFILAEHMREVGIKVPQ